jgi:hypothetical protein
MTGPNVPTENRRTNAGTGPSAAAKLTKHQATEPLPTLLEHGGRRSKNTSAPQPDTSQQL